MSAGCRWLLPTLAVLALVGDAVAQRGGGRAGRRGPSEEIRTRSGAYFVDVTLPSVAAGAAVALEQCDLVATAVQESSLSLLYLYDASEAEVTQAFEQTMFGDGELSVALRCFQCGRIDLSRDSALKTEFIKKIPMFIAFDGQGRPAAEAVFRGYKAKPQQLTNALYRAAAKHAKMPMKSFVKRYRDWLKDLVKHEGKERLLEDKRERLLKKNPPPQAELANSVRDQEALTEKKNELLDDERKLLQDAKVPPRPDGARRLGDRRRGRGRGGARGG